MRDYEALWIVNASLTDDELGPIVKRFRGVVEEMGAQVEYLDRWGERRRLAYEVKGQREGAYVIMNFKAEPAAAKELDRVLKLSEDVYRHMIIYLEPDEVEPSKAERDRARYERVEAPAPVETPAAAAPAVEEAAEAPAVEEETAAPEAEAAPIEEAPTEAPAEEAPAAEAEATEEA